VRDRVRSATAFLLATACFGVFSQEAQPHPRIAIRWEVVSNSLAAGGASCELTLNNQGTVPLSSAGWTLFFNFSRDIIPQSLPASVHLTHINGDFYKLEPTATFQPVKPGDDVEIPFSAQAPIINTSAGPDGFYFVFADSTGHSFAPELATT
jgi:hexosaminidase